VSDEQSEQASTRLRNAITGTLLDIAEHGEPVYDNDGTMTGRQTPSASMIAKLIDWYKYLQSEGGSIHDAPLGSIVQRMREQGHQMPDVGEGDDPATE